MRIFIFCFILLLTPAAAAAAPIFNAQTHTLHNGLEIVVIENHRSPVVTHMVWYAVGAADEPVGHSGLAHFLEHLMFKGSEGLASSEFSKRIRALGGRDNAFTSQDYTAYFQSIPVAHLPEVMRMEAGRMRGLNPPLSEVDSERKVILEERRQRTDNDPHARFGEEMNARAYINHPYGTPIIGWAHEMEGLSWDMVKAFYDRFYAPDNAILIVAGDVKPKAVFALAEEIYGPIPAQNLPPRFRPRSPPMATHTHVEMRDPDVREPVVRALYRVPSYAQNAKESLALQLLEEIIDGGPIGRLYQSLVVKDGLASNVGLGYGAYGLDESQLWLYATPKPGIAPETVHEALRAALRKVVEEGVRAQELENARTRLQAATIYARDSLSGPAMLIGRALVTGVKLEDVEYWPDRLNEITTEDIQAVATRYLGEGSYVSGTLLPEEGGE